MSAVRDRSGGFDETGFAALARNEVGHFWFGPRNRLLLGLADKYFPEATSYLEVGCGTGFVLSAFASARRWDSIMGVDMHQEGLLHAQQRVGADVVLRRADAGCLRDLGISADLVGAYDVLEHIEDDDETIRAIFSIILPGGGFIATVPQHPFLWSAADDMGRHVRRYCSGELERKLVRAGFQLIFSTSYTALLFPLLFASRVRAAEGRKLIRREMEPSKGVNALLRSVLHAEVSASLAGLRWPVGGSRVVVARKPSL